MLSPVLRLPGLVTGERLTVEEFLRRWEHLPELKNAELIDGVVFVPSPVSLDHGSLDSMMIWWLTEYSYATPGCQSGNNCTWLMLGDAPQPDAHLRILPEHGGQSRNQEQYGAGAPELVVEISLTSTEIDFGSKLALYERAGVREYITVAMFGQRIVWRVLRDAHYEDQVILEDGVLKSAVFPGLWLSVPAFWREDLAKMAEVLRAGLSTGEHRRFVAQLAAAK